MSAEIQKIFGIGNKIIEPLADSIDGSEVRARAVPFEVHGKTYRLNFFLEWKNGPNEERIYLNINQAKERRVEVAVKGANPHSEIYRTEYTGEPESIATIQECLDELMANSEACRVVNNEESEYSSYDVLTQLSNPELNPGNEMPRVLGIKIHDGIAEEWFNNHVPKSVKVSGFTGPEFYKVKAES